MVELASEDRDLLCHSCERAWPLPYQCSSEPSFVASLCSSEGGSWAWDMYATPAVEAFPTDCLSWPPGKAVVGPVDPEKQEVVAWEHFDQQMVALDLEACFHLRCLVPSGHVAPLVDQRVQQCRWVEHQANVQEIPELVDRDDLSLPVALRLRLVADR